MLDDPAFIRMIAANPDDDAPRLVYADYLEESGDPVHIARAEFIRVQVEKARLVPDTPRSNALWYRDVELLKWARQWRAALPQIPTVRYGGFFRGFIQGLDATAQPLVSNFRTMLDHLPLQGVLIREANDRDAEILAASPDLAELPSIEVVLLRGSAVSAINHFIERGPWPGLRRIRFWLQRGDWNEAVPPGWEEAQARCRRVFTPHFIYTPGRLY
jgi:uncharacterized protein (TIGR02996 family)